MLFVFKVSEIKIQKVLGRDDFEKFLNDEHFIKHVSIYVLLNDDNTINSYKLTFYHTFMKFCYLLSEVRTFCNTLRESKNISIHSSLHNRHIIKFV